MFRIGVWPLGSPTHTAAVSCGVTPTNQALVLSCGPGLAGGGPVAVETALAGRAPGEHALQDVDRLLATSGVEHLHAGGVVLVDDRAVGAADPLDVVRIGCTPLLATVWHADAMSSGEISLRRWRADG